MKQLNPLIFLLIVIFPLSITAKTVPYSKIDTILKKTWDATYPVPYTRIVKKDVLGKGIKLYKRKKMRYYLYTFLIFVPRYTLIKDQAVPNKQNSGRVLPVKLFYYPNRKENNYEVKLERL